MKSIISGDYAKTLKQETFTDAKKTNYLEAVKYVANLVWNGEIILTSVLIFNVCIISFPRVPDQAGAQPP